MVLVLLALLFAPAMSDDEVKYVRTYQPTDLAEEPFAGTWEFFDIKGDRKTVVAKVKTDDDGNWVDHRCYDAQTKKFSRKYTYEEVWGDERKKLTDPSDIKCAEFFTSNLSVAEYAYLSVTCPNPPAKSDDCVSSWVKTFEKMGCEFPKKIISGCEQSRSADGTRALQKWACLISSSNCVSAFGQICPKGYEYVEEKVCKKKPAAAAPEDKKSAPGKENSSGAAK